MALVVDDRVKQTSSTTGTSDFTLDGFLSGFLGFDAIGSTNETYYCAYAGSQFEIGRGTVTIGADIVLSRTTILASSSAGAKVDFTASPIVFCTIPAQEVPLLSLVGGFFRGFVLFTSGGTWNKPSWFRRGVFETLGGGGGGGGGNQSGTESGAGGGGGGGGYSRRALTDAQVGSSESVVVGSGGIGRITISGDSGGTSSFGAHLSATGGNGGNGVVTTSSGIALGGNAGTGVGGDLNTAGDDGGNGLVIDNVAQFGGDGGGSFFGGRRRGARNASGLNGSQFGGGGSGGSATSGFSDTSGGNGHAGVVIAWEMD